MKAKLVADQHLPAARLQSSLQLVDALQPVRDLTSTPLFQALIKAAGEVGIRQNPDYNGAAQDGIVMSQASIARASVK